MKNRAGRQVYKRYDLPIIIVVAVLLRVAAAIYFGDKVVELPGAFDQISYHNLALRVASGNGFTFGEDWWPLTRANQPTAHWSYLYTLFIVAVYKAIGLHPLAVRVIQAIIIGILQPYLAFLIGNTVINRSVGLIYASLASLYAYFIYYAATLMTESFFITATMAGLYLTIRISHDGKRSDEKDKKKRTSGYWSYVSLGIVLGAAVLLRQVFLLVAPILLSFIIWNLRKESLKGVMLSALMIGLMILPFTIYNIVRFDQFILLNTNAGFAFFWANHPIYGTEFQAILSPELGRYQDLIPPELRHLNEAGLDQALLWRGVRFIVEDPLRYLALSVSRIPVYFKFWPSSDSSVISNISRVGSFGLTLPFLIIGSINSWKEFMKKDFFSRPDILILIVFIAIYTSIHLLSWALIRYRLPVDAVFLFFSAYGIWVMLERFRIHLKNRNRTWRNP